MSPPSTPDKYPPEEAYTSPPVAIEVGSGETKRVFQIRKDVLTFYSGYFSAALNGRFAEADEGVCRLPEEDPIIFEMFQHWMHDRTLYDSTLEPALLLSYLQIAQLWIFADAHDIPALQNKAIDIFARKRSLTKESLTRECGVYISENTVESSPIRKLVCEMVGWIPYAHTTLQEEMFGNVVRTLPCVTSLRAWPPQGAPTPITNICRYHVHGDDGPCGRS